MTVAVVGTRHDTRRSHPGPVLAAGTAAGATDPNSATAGLATAPPQRPPSGGAAIRDRIVDLLIAIAKLATVAFGIDALINHRSRRLRGKAVRTRAVGYVGGLLIVPLIWRLLPDRGRYPRELDLAVTVPLFLDAGGNAFGVYEQAHIDDVVHVANSAIVAGIAGSLFAPRVDERWQAALAGAGVSVAAGAWEGGVRRVAAGRGRDEPDLRGHDGRHHRGLRGSRHRRRVRADPDAASQVGTTASGVARALGA